MIYILYSADYELYLGALSQPEAEVLIRPTEQLLATCHRLTIPLTLFADLACFWRYRELGLDHFPQQAEAQLVEAIRQGHDVQTHLHPHWFRTRIENRRFLFAPEHYLLGTFSPDPDERLQLTCSWLQRAAHHLTALLTPHAPGYRCLAFRAGGYGLQPEASMILQALVACGYRIDSSIIPGARIVTGVQQVDFTHLPGAGHYWIDAASGLDRRAEPGSGICEIPIAAHRFGSRERLAVRLPEALRQGWRLLTDTHPPPSRGTACNLPPESGHPAHRWKQAYWRAHAILSNDFQRLELGTDLRALLACFEGHVRACRREQPGAIFLSMNIHPKGIQPAHLDTLIRFHRRVMQEHPGRIRAITFQQAWQILQKPENL
ncbi:MAG: hypothetical protein HQM00_00750 [Magnetococcales bacterium]|nr:hypothetical protein [Magnetococcales bacterium]